MTGGKSCGLATAAEWIARNSSKRLAGSMRQSISFAIVIGPMAKSLPDAFARWAYVTGQRRRDRHGRMDMLNG
jgi:hypothetical protein